MRYNVSVQNFMEGTMPKLVRAVEQLTKEVNKLNVNLEIVARMDTDKLEDSCNCEECRGMEH